MIKTGVEFLDKLFSDNLNIVTCVYGQAATGKTTMCSVIASSFAKAGKKVLYIDSEKGFSSDRFRQISGGNKLLDKLVVMKVNDFREQYYMVKELVELNNFDCLIIDTLTFFYRKEVKENRAKVNNMLKHHLNHLYSISRKGKLVLFTNQVYSKMESNIPSPVAGDLIVPGSDLLIRLEKNPRKFVVMKPHIESFDFDIVEMGFVAKKIN